MQITLRIARFQWRVLRGNAKALLTHALSLTILVAMTLVQLKGTGSEEAAGMAAGILLLTACAAPMALGVHVLVSERARGTMEALVLLPISKLALVAGKGLMIQAIALAEIAGVAVVLAAAARAEGNAGLAAAMASPVLWVVLCALAPLLSLLLTLTAIVVSGRAEDAQTASNQSFIVALPVIVFLGTLWFGALTLRPSLIAVALMVTLVLCAVALRASVAWLSDETLAARRA